MRFLRLLLMLGFACSATSCVTATLWKEAIAPGNVNSDTLHFDVSTLVVVETRPGEPAALMVEIVREDGSQSPWFDLRQQRGRPHIDAVLARRDAVRWDIRIDDHDRRRPDRAVVELTGELESLGRIVDPATLPDGPVAAQGRESPWLDEMLNRPWMRWLGIENRLVTDLHPTGWLRDGEPVDPLEVQTAFETADFDALERLEVGMLATRPDADPVGFTVRGDALWFVTFGAIRVAEETGKTTWSHRSVWGWLKADRVPETRTRSRIVARTDVELSMRVYSTPGIGLRILQAIALTPFTLAGDVLLGWADPDFDLFEIRDRARAR